MNGGVVALAREIEAVISIVVRLKVFYSEREPDEGSFSAAAERSARMAMTVSDCKRRKEEGEDERPLYAALAAHFFLELFWGARVGVGVGL